MMAGWCFLHITLALDDDLLEAARALPRQQDSTLVDVISGLARESLRSPASGCSYLQKVLSGWPLLPIRSSGADGDRAWCRVVEFAEEFGISVSYDTLVLAERRGG